MSMDIDEPQQSALHDQILRLSGLDVPDELVSQTLKDVFSRCMLNLPLDIAKRLRPYIWIESNEFEIHSCDFGATLDKLKFVKNKDGVSDSWILFGTLLNQPVAIKVAARPLQMTISSHFLSIERYIYKNIINPIVLCGFSPHVLIYYASLSCNEFYNLPELDKEVKKFKKALRAQQQKFNINEIEASVVERATNGTTLSDFLDKAVDDPKYSKELIALLFQIFYTLKVFSQLGLSHNDLHSGNIFVVPATTTTKYYQISTNDYRKVESVFDVRIFDFDRGAKVSTEHDGKEIENHGLSDGFYCQKFGQCNGVNERSEIFPVLVSFNIQTRKVCPEINTLLTDILPIEILERTHKDQQVESTDIPMAYPTIPGHTLAFIARLCTCNDVDCSTCSVLNDPRIKNLDQILDLDQFTSYRVVKEEISQDTFIWRLPSVSGEETERNWQELHA